MIAKVIPVVRLISPWAGNVKFLRLIARNLRTGKSSCVIASQEIEYYCCELLTRVITVIRRILHGSGGRIHRICCWKAKKIDIRVQAILCYKGKQVTLNNISSINYMLYLLFMMSI